MGEYFKDNIDLEFYHKSQVVLNVYSKTECIGFNLKDRDSVHIAVCTLSGCVQIQGLEPSKAEFEARLCHIDVLKAFQIHAAQCIFLFAPICIFHSPPYPTIHCGPTRRLFCLQWWTKQESGLQF